MAAESQSYQVVLRAGKTIRKRKKRDATALAPRPTQEQDISFDGEKSRPPFTRYKSQLEQNEEDSGNEYEYFYWL
jgi:hypothetical protein